MTPDQVWPLWRRLLKGFGAGRTLRIALTSPAVIGAYGVDFASTLRVSVMGRHAEQVLADADDATLEALAALAAVNVDRNEAMWRMAVMFYISVPVTLALAAAQLAPDVLRYVLERAPLAFWIAVSSLVAFMLYSFMTQWRARQAAAVLTLIRIERALLSPPVAAPPVARDAPPRRRRAPG